MFPFSYPISARAIFFSFSPYLVLPITRSLFYIFPRFFILTFPSFSLSLSLQPPSYPSALPPPPLPPPPLPPPPPPPHTHTHTHTPCHLAEFLAPLPLRSKSFPPTHKLFISLQAGIYGRNMLRIGGDCGSAILIYALSLLGARGGDFFLAANCSRFICF